VRAILSRGSGCSPHPFLQAGDRVRVVRGVLTGIEGVFIRAAPSLSWSSSVEMIQRSVSVNVAASDVEPVSRTIASVRPPQSLLFPSVLNIARRGPGDTSFRVPTPKLRAQPVDLVPERSPVKSIG
jgi:hypothetical protein